METKMGLEAVDEILGRHNNDPSALIGILMDVQGSYNYLPRESLDRISKRLNVPLPNVYSVATFYRAFSLTPRGRHIVHVCMGTACHVRGAKRVLEQIERKLNIKGGQTTPDMEFTIETVNCLGACALAPLVVMDGKNHGKVNANQITRILDGCKSSGDEGEEE